MRPAHQLGPLILASPHSGCRYPADFLDIARLDHATLRLSEDCYVDELVGSALARAEGRLGDRTITTKIAANMTLLHVDAAQATVNSTKIE